MAETFIGIDVAKAELVVGVRPAGESWTVPNDPVGLRALVPRLQALAPTLVVLEATGGYELSAVAALAAAGLPVVVVNPRQVRDFGRATGQFARPTASMPPCSRSSPSACVHRFAPWPTRHSRPSMRCSPGVAS